MEYEGFDKEAVKRSLLTLKALTFQPTGAIIAAATTSIPEKIGGVRNWDYRYSWIRDSSFTLYALLKVGYKEEAIRWKEWLLKAVAGTPSQINIMYGIRGERRLTETNLDWLKGYENSTPVRIGNAAHNQFQLDVFGELMATSLLGSENGIPINDDNWRIEKKMIEYVCQHWNDPDKGIWEVRGPKRHFTHSKMMAWLALKCAVDTVNIYGLDGDVERWTKLRDKIHEDICRNGFNKDLNSFVQSYGSRDLDASLLMMGYFDFLPITDPRIIGTIQAVKNGLMKDGYVLRYNTRNGVDGLPDDEGAFLPCSFWLVDNLRMLGRHEEALELYHRIQSVRNDVGSFAEEYATDLKRMVGNFPQAFSHVAQVISSMGLEKDLKK